MLSAESQHQLGFEHGYAGEPTTYPERADYVAGHKFGERFRSVVLRLAPSLVKGTNGEYIVTFPYTGWMMHRDPK